VRVTSNSISTASTSYRYTDSATTAGVYCYRVRACLANNVCSAHSSSMCATSK
jgi:hypothetical protein